MSFHSIYHVGEKKLCELTRHLLAQLILIAQDNYYDLKFNRLYSGMKRIINLCGKAANWKKNFG